MFKMGCKFNLLVNIRELLDAAMQHNIVQGLKGNLPKIKKIKKSIKS
jgi:hypothetical protein